MNENCKCPLSSECNAKRGYFDCSKKLLKLVEEKFNSAAQSGLTNSDYTAALEQGLRDLRYNGYIDINERSFREVAARLNSAIKVQQNCA